MSTSPVASEEQLSSNQRRTGTFILFGLIVLFSLAEFFVGVFLIPRFAVIYRDLLSNRPLPSATAVVLHFRWVLVGFAFIWPIAEFILVQKRALRRFLVCILVILILSITFTTIALFLPICGTIIKGASPVSSEKRLPDSIELR